MKESVRIVIKFCAVAASRLLAHSETRSASSQPVPLSRLAQSSGCWLPGWSSLRPLSQRVCLAEDVWDDEGGNAKNFRSAGEGLRHGTVCVCDLVQFFVTKI